jgi:hypothetical protein
MDIIIEKINRSLEGDSNNFTFRDSSMMNWITLKFNDSNKEIEYNDTKSKHIINTIRKIILLCFIYAGIELVKELVLYFMKKIPFVSFYYYFGLIIIFLMILLITYKFEDKVRYLIPVILVVLCIFYCFYNFYVDMIEFSKYMTILAIIFMLRGTSLSFVIFISTAFYIL